MLKHEKKYVCEFSLWLNDCSEFTAREPSQKQYACSTSGRICERLNGKVFVCVETGVISC